MASFEAELAAARELSVDALADAIETIGFECTRCGACCRGSPEDPHTATLFPDEVRALTASDGPTPDGEPAHDAPSGSPREWRDVARPMPFGLDSGADETFEWALQTDACGNCAFYADGDADEAGTCTVYENRPMICETYPFSVDVAGTTPAGEVVDAVGPLLVHECEGLGRDIERADAEALAAALKRRTVRELEEAIAVRDRYRPVDLDETVVHDSEGAKRQDGTAIDRE